MEEAFLTIQTLGSVVIVMSFSLRDLVLTKKISCFDFQKLRIIVW